MADPIIYNGEVRGVRYGVGPFKWANCPFGLFGQDSLNNLDTYFLAKVSEAPITEENTSGFTCVGIIPKNTEQSWGGPIDPNRRNAEWWGAGDHGRNAGFSRAMQNLCCFVQKDPVAPILYGGFSDSCNKSDPEKAYWVTYDNKGGRVYIHHPFKRIAMNKGVLQEPMGMIRFILSYSSSIAPDTDEDKDKKETTIDINPNLLRGMRYGTDRNMDDVFSIADVSNDGKKVLVLNYQSFMSTDANRISNSLHRICEVVFTVTAPEEEEDGKPKKPIATHTVATLKDHEDLYSFGGDDFATETGGEDRWQHIFGTVDGLSNYGNPASYVQQVSAMLAGANRPPLEHRDSEASGGLGLKYELNHSDNKYADYEYHLWAVAALPENEEEDWYKVVRDNSGCCFNFDRGLTGRNQTETYQNTLGAFYNAQNAVEYVELDIETKTSMSASRPSITSITGRLVTVILVRSNDEEPYAQERWYLGAEDEVMSIWVSGESINYVTNVSMTLRHGSSPTREYTQNLIINENVSVPMHEIRVTYEPVGEGLSWQGCDQETYFNLGNSTHIISAKNGTRVDASVSFSATCTGNIFDSQKLLDFYTDKYGEGHSRKIEDERPDRSFLSHLENAYWWCSSSGWSRKIPGASAMWEHFYEERFPTSSRYVKTGGANFGVKVYAQNGRHDHRLNLEGSWYIYDAIDVLFHDMGMYSGSPDSATDTYSEMFFEYHGSFKALSFVAYRSPWSGAGPVDAIRSNVMTIDGVIGNTERYVIEDRGRVYDLPDRGYTRLTDCASYNPFTKQLAYGFEHPVSWSGNWGFWGSALPPEKEEDTAKKAAADCWKTQTDIEGVTYGALAVVSEPEAE